MDTREVFNIIAKEHIKQYKDTNDKFINWFWSVGFSEINVDESSNHIVCEVKRPNKFIGKWDNSIINFLVYITEKVFKPLGYNFELVKSDDIFYNEAIDLLSKNNSIDES